MKYYWNCIVRRKFSFAFQQSYNRGVKSPALSQYDIIPICLGDSTMFVDITKSVMMQFRFTSIHKSAIEMIHYLFFLLAREKAPSH